MGGCAPKSLSLLGNNDAHKSLYSSCVNTPHSATKFFFKIHFLSARSYLEVVAEGRGMDAGHKVGVGHMETYSMHNPFETSRMKLHPHAHAHIMIVI